MTDIELNDRPTWLLELENRKRKPRLAHEAGAGAPCVICKAACPGLDLHFWRKICKNCKCNKDDHDVDDEDFPQFDLLFGSFKKYKKKPTLLHISNEKGYTEEAFEWVPPDTTKEIATDYMKALPVEKLPIKGSAGAALRRQLLQKQLPLHDIDHKVCDELSEQEKKEFEKYLENIKKYVGQGTVRKILSARPFNRSFMTPANATDMQHFSPQHKINAQSSTVQLRVPSSFTPKSSYKKDLYENLMKQNESLEVLNNSSQIKDIAVLENYNLTGNSGNIVKSESVEDGLYNKGIYPTSLSKTDNSHHIANKEDTTTKYLKYPNSVVIRNDNSAIASPSNSLEHCTETYKDKLKSPPVWSPSYTCIKPTNNDAYIAECILADTLLPPSTIHTHEIIGSTLDKKDLMLIREKLTTKYRKQENQGQVPYNAPSFARDLNSSDLLSKNESTLSQNVHTGNFVEKAAVPATMKNHTETLNALRDDIQEADQNILESTPIKADTEIIKSTSQVIQSIAPTSKITNNSVFKNSSASSSRMHQRANQAELTSFVTPSAVIYSEKLQNQVFPYETIGTPTQSVQNIQSIEHVKNAIEELTTMEDSIDSQNCQNCEEEIRVGDVAVITEKTKNAVWHPGCFVCSMCDELLVDLVYFYYKDKLYCGRDLATLLGIPRCFACDELIVVREYTVAEGHNYHVKHFCCWDCDIPLAGKQYITENDRPLCLPCYQKTYAKTCNTCEKVIAADQQGVAVKDLNFHATELCFCCYICNKNLLHGKIAVKERKLFCSKECISKFLHA